MPLVELAFRRKLLSESARLELRERIEVIAKMISGRISGMDKRQA